MYWSPQQVTCHDQGKFPTEQNWRPVWVIWVIHVSLYPLPSQLRPHKSEYGHILHMMSKLCWEQGVLPFWKKMAKQNKPLLKVSFTILKCIASVPDSGEALWSDKDISRVYKTDRLRPIFFESLLWSLFQLVFWYHIYHSMLDQISKRPITSFITASFCRITKRFNLLLYITSYFTKKRW